MRTVRSRVDVSQLPTVAFGPRDMMWWGTIGFMAIEGTTLFICAASYLYLRLNFYTWPPEHTLRPALFWPTLQVAAMFLSNVPQGLAHRAALNLDLGGVRRWMLVVSILSIAFVAIRWQEFLAINARWDTNAYGSIMWITLGFHGTILLLQAIETMIFTIFLFGDRIEEKHFSDVVDSAFYWYFMTGSWIVLYPVVFLTPLIL
jgi:cytochrome c oxidase subunit 3